jgi:hypothetical protein
MEDVWLNLSNIYGLEQFDNFEMNQQGVLRNFKTNRIIEGSISNNNYVVFNLNQDGLRKTVLKHRLIAELFVWNPDGKSCVDHQDRNKLNNEIENLRWCSASENNRNRSMSKDNTSGKMNIYKCLNKGYPYWKVQFGHRETGNRHEKLFPRDLNSDVIPAHVIAYRDEYAKKWKGAFNPV